MQNKQKDNNNKKSLQWYLISRMISLSHDVLFTWGFLTRACSESFIWIKILITYVFWISFFKGTVSLGNKLFLNSTHLLDIHFGANNTLQQLKFSCWRNHVSKIHIRRHFPSIDMGWRPLAHVCLWLHVSSYLHSTRRRYIVSINMASIKAQHCLPISGIQIILFLDRYNQMQSQLSRIL